VSARDDEQDGDELVEEAAEHAERAVQEREEMARKASLAGSADNGDETAGLESEVETHRQAAEDQEAASSDDAHDAG
jgi:hypothetical protein